MSRPDFDQARFIAALTRHQPALAAFCLRGLIPQQRYEVENFDGGKEVLTGGELMQGHTITLNEKPGSAVLLIKAVK